MKHTRMATLVVKLVMTATILALITYQTVAYTLQVWSNQNICLVFIGGMYKSTIFTSKCNCVMCVPMT